MIELTIPPDPEALQVLRATAGAIGAKAGLTLDQIDDVRNAVEESAVLLLAAGEPLTMRADHAAKPFLVAVSTPSSQGVMIDPESLAWLVLRGTTDQVDVNEDGEGTAVVMRFAQVSHHVGGAA